MGRIERVFNGWRGVAVFAVSVLMMESGTAVGSPTDRESVFSGLCSVCKYSIFSLYCGCFIICSLPVCESWNRGYFPFIPLVSAWWRTPGGAASPPGGESLAGHVSSPRPDGLSDSLELPSLAWTVNPATATMMEERWPSWLPPVPAATSVGGGWTTGCVWWTVSFLYCPAQRICTHISHYLISLFLCLRSLVLTDSICLSQQHKVVISTGDG